MDLPWSLQVSSLRVTRVYYGFGLDGMWAFHDAHVFLAHLHRCEARVVLLEKGLV